jgi:hypothetical protein
MVTPAHLIFHAERTMGVLRSDGDFPQSTCPWQPLKMPITNPDCSCHSRAPAPEEHPIFLENPYARAEPESRSKKRFS